MNKLCRCDDRHVRLSMKRSDLSYSEWNCIISKNLNRKFIQSDFFEGYIEMIDIKEVTKPQIWKFNGKDIVVCDNGIKWLSILPKNDFYCITAMLNENEEIILWYIDMIASQGITEDGTPYFDDLYLDLVVYPDGTIIVDDMDELQEALAIRDITSEQYNLAILTSRELQEGLLKNIDEFTRFTYKCLSNLR